MIAALTLAAYLRLAPLGVDPAPIVLPDDEVVEGVDCRDWEPYRDAQGEEVWRANLPTLIATSDGGRRVGPGDVRAATCAELFYQIQFTCAPEFGANVWDD